MADTSTQAVADAFIAKTDPKEFIGSTVDLVLAKAFLDKRDLILMARDTIKSVKDRLKELEDKLQVASLEENALKGELYRRNVDANRLYRDPRHGSDRILLHEPAAQ